MPNCVRRWFPKSSRAHVTQFGLCQERGQEQKPINRCYMPNCSFLPAKCAGEKRAESSQVFQDI